MFVLSQAQQEVPPWLENDSKHSLGGGVAGFGGYATRDMRRNPDRNSHVNFIQMPETEKEELWGWIYTLLKSYRLYVLKSFFHTSTNRQNQSHPFCIKNNWFVFLWFVDVAGQISRKERFKVLTNKNRPQRSKATKQVFIWKIQQIWFKKVSTKKL